MWRLRGPRGPWFRLPSRLTICGCDLPSHCPHGSRRSVWVLRSRLDARKGAGQGTGSTCLLREFRDSFVKPILLTSHWQEFSHVGTPWCKGRRRNVYSGQSCAQVQSGGSATKERSEDDRLTTSSYSCPFSCCWSGQILPPFGYGTMVVPFLPFLLLPQCVAASVSSLLWRTLGKAVYGYCSLWFITKYRKAPAELPS